MEHEKFHCRTLEELQKTAREAGASLPLSQNRALLSKPLAIQGRTLPNRIAIQPMEGCDGTAEGAPGELTLRRYRRFAESGAGLIWLEAAAVVPEGRANPRQLMLTEENLSAYQRLVEGIRCVSREKYGWEPLLVLQMTHSGRYSKPHGRPEPLIACQNPLFEKEAPLPPERILSDEALDRLPERYAQSAALAERAGFDGVDVKACHRYLMSELLSAHTRPGKYGGSFENRTRLLLESVQAAKAAVSQRMMVASRLNVYDGFPYPYGFGVSPDGGTEPDLGEPIRLVRLLHEKCGMELVDVTIGNPYVNPHVNRPYDGGPYPPPEHPLAGVARMCRCVSGMKRALPGVAVISSGNSYLRQFSENLAAGMLEQGGADLIGFGREAFAYPEFAADLIEGRGMKPQKCCIACGKCTELMRAGSMAGCVVRDSEVYLPLYQRDVLKKDIGGVQSENSRKG